MNSMVYPVHGGMEDWMYAAGWDESAPVRQCISLVGGRRALSALSSVSYMRQRLNISPLPLPSVTSLSQPALSHRLLTESQYNTTESPLQQQDQEPSETVNTTRLTNHTIFDNHNRAIVFLVETSDDKRPKDEDLGTTHEVGILCVYYIV